MPTRARLSRGWLHGLLLVASCFSVLQADNVASAGTPEIRRIVGMFQYMADAALLTICATGERVPVAMEEGYVELERAYLDAKIEAGALLLVTIDGHFAQRPRMEGEGTREYVIVEQFRQVWPQESCEKSSINTPLGNTYWRLVAIGGMPTKVHTDQQEMHIILQGPQRGVKGFAGCNRIKGSYSASGDTLRFGAIMSTKTECPHLDEQTAFLDMLAEVSRFEILGESLALSGHSGLLARFRAMYFK